MKIFLFLAFLLCNYSSVLASAPYPPTPSQDRLKRLQELGRQNELKYGSGIVVSTKSQISTVKPSVVPLPTTVEIKSHQITDLPIIIQWLVKLFIELNIIPKLALNTNTLNTPSLTSTPKATLTPTEKIGADELWQKGFNVWINNKDYVKASEYYQQALKIDPNHVPTLASYGYILGAFYNRFADGEAMLKKAMQLDPTWAYAPYNLGLLYDISGRRDEGIYWLQYTVDNFSTHPDIEWFKDHLRVAKEWKY